MSNYSKHIRVTLNIRFFVAQAHMPRELVKLFVQSPTTQIPIFCFPKLKNQKDLVMEYF